MARSATQLPIKTCSNGTCLREGQAGKARASQKPVKAIPIAGPGPNLARSLTGLGLIEGYRIYLHPEVFGEGTSFFAAARPPLRLAGSEQVDDTVMRLSYVPA